MCMGDICIPNMKFLCLTLWQGEVCTDDANDYDGQNMIVQGPLVDKLNEPKSWSFLTFYFFV